MPYINLDALPDAEKTIESPYQWRSASSTHPGRVRYVNEDAFLDKSELQLWAVADGMGGHCRGDYASKAVIKALDHFTHLPSLKDNIQDIENRLIDSNEDCRNAFRRKQVGSTVATLFAHQHHCFFLWAGDSRIYRLRQNTLKLMTEDHSVAQEKLTRGEINEEQAASHPTAHILTRAIGAHPNLELGIRHSTIEANDRYLICSDGLYNDLSTEQLKSELKNASIQEALKQLIDAALARGGRDNITAIVVAADEK